MENKKRNIFGWIAGALTSVVAGGWAVFTYVVPDPSVLGVSLINWKNILLLVVFLLSTIWLFVYFWCQRLPAFIKHIVIVVLYLTSFGASFVVGMKYEDPLFGSTKKAAEYIYNDSTTISGERSVKIDNIIILLSGCKKELGNVSCDMHLFNEGYDKEISFHGDTRAFDDVSNELSLQSLVVGTSTVKPSHRFSLTKGVKTKIVVYFKSVDETVGLLTSLRLKFIGVSGIRKGVVFNSVPLE